MNRIVRYPPECDINCEDLWCPYTHAWTVLEDEDEDEVKEEN